MKQTTFLSEPDFLCRKKDPQTSKLAAAETEKKLGVYQQVVLRMVKDRPYQTANELVSHVPNNETLRKRFHELQRRGLIRVAGTRKCRITGKQARTWE